MAKAVDPRTGRRKMTYRRKDADRDVLTLARDRIAHLFEHYDHVAVSFSGGKDSTVCLNLVAEEAARRDRLPLDVVFHDEEAIPLQTEDYLRRVGQRPDIALRWYALPVRHRNACSRKAPWWFPWAPEARDRWVRPLPPEALTTLDGFPLDPPEARISIPDTNGLLFDPRRYGTVAMVLGIRAQESITRERAVSRRIEEGWIVADAGRGNRGNVTKAYPIYDWRTEDVWTAPNLFGWDYNRAYDAMEMAGVAMHHQRISPAFGEEPLEKLWTYSVCFPEVWDKMTDRVPGAATAARYARTELYGYHGRPEKPPGMPWPDFLASFVAQFPDKERGHVAGRVRYFIDRHQEITDDPIVEHAAHPMTGTSWDFLLMIAMRGDFKQRKQPGAKVSTQGDALDRMWRKYEAERDRMLAEGEL